MIIGINGYAGSGKDTVGTIVQYLQADTNIPLKDVLKKTPHHIWWLEERSGWEIKKWAGKLKVVASLLTGIPIENFEDQEFKKTLLGPEWGTVTLTPLSSIPVFANIEFNSLISVRDFLQRLGTDAIRDGLHKDTWVNALMSDYKIIPTASTHWFNADWDEVGQIWFVGDRQDLPKECRNRYYDKKENYFYLNDKVELPNWIITDCRFPNEFRAIKDNGGVVIRIERDCIKPVNAHPSEIALDDFQFDFVIENNGSLEDLTRSVTFMLNKFDESRNSI